MKTIDDVTPLERDTLLNIAITTPYTIGTVLWVYNLLGTCTETEAIFNYAVHHNVKIDVAIDELSELKL